MKVSFNGYGEQAATFEAAEDVTAGMPVKVTDNGMVGLCADGDIPCGVAVSVRSGMAAVQLKGYVTLPYSGTEAVGVGWQNISAGESGSIRLNDAGRGVLVTDVDSAAATCGIIL